MLCLMLHLQARLLDDHRPAVRRYASELPQWIPATASFTYSSARYLDISTPEDYSIETNAPSTAIQINTTPTLWDPNDLTPPPYPDIAWWWDHVQQ